MSEVIMRGMSEEEAVMRGGGDHEDMSEEDHEGYE